jgi:outer membrane protein TolC
MRRRAAYPFALLVLTLAGHAGAETAPAPTERLTVEDAVRMARANHPTVGAARRGEDVARARVREAWAPILPSLQGSFGYLPQTANPSFGPSFARALSAGSAKPTTLPNTLDLYNYWSVQLGIQWTLFDFGRVYYAWRAAREGRVAAAEGTDVAALQVEFDARSAFYNALAAEQAVAVARESVATQQRHFDQMKGFVEVGTRTRVDLAQSQADLASAQLTLVKAIGMLDGARATLAGALGVDHFAPVTLVPPPETSEAEAVPAADTLADEAVARRPEPRQFEAMKRQAIQQSKSSRAGYYPTLSLGLGPTFAGTAIGSLTPNFQVSLVLSYPALGLNPLLVSGQVHEAEANAAVAAEQARGARLALRIEAAQAKVALETARGELATARLLLAAAKERRDLADARFGAGVGTTLELSDAEQAYVNAEGQVIQAQVDLGIAHARIDRIYGR